MGDTTRGLYHKFNIERTDGTSAPGQKHDGCDYFVLDLTHDKHAIPALRAYIKSCKAEYPFLAADLSEKLIESAESALSIALKERDEARENEARYLAWRGAHAAGLRPFLPIRIPADEHTLWSYPFAFDPPNDEWMSSAPERRCEMIDAAIDAARRLGTLGERDKVE